MKFIYDQAGKRIAEYFDSSSIEDIQKDYLDKKIFISEWDLGERAIVENGQIRAETRLDRVLNNTEELQEGEYIENKEIKYKEKPNKFHFWDSNKEEWVYDQGLEINSLEEELGSLELKIYNLEQEITGLKKDGKTFAAKKLEKEVAELDKKYQEKITRYEELEG
ncbi:hypothetical protein [Sebaldella termitidis]|uniref:hypothetical protein n=1 Tax=Sebaldella termitidis TaxID=826 RepID=UPI003EBEC3F6